MGKGLEKGNFRKRSKRQNEPQVKTVADFLCLMSSPENRCSLEEFRKTYEAEHGRTDMTRYYTSMWPTEDQDLLIKIDPVAYFEGLPPFVQAFFRRGIDLRLKEGTADDLPELQMKLLALKYFHRDQHERG